MNFGLRLKESRLRLGMAQNELADMLRLNPAAVSKYETGRSNPDLDTLAKICEVLSVSSDYLLGISDSPKPEANNSTDELWKKFDSLPETLKYEVQGYINARLMTFK